MGAFVRGLLFWTIVLGAAGWAFLAIWFTVAPPALRTVAAVCCLGLMILPPLAMRPRRRGLAVAALPLAAVLAWFFHLQPANDRDWQPDLAVLPWARVEGQSVTLGNVRHCDYRSETDFTCSYDDRVVDLGTLQGIDLFLVYWGSPHIAHTMLSFDFKGQPPVCFSIETRKEKGESYSAVKGFFRRYEQIYVMADERDVVRLRTNFRHEDVYLYRLVVAPETARQVFLDYLREINRLNGQPQWYNALTANCTTSIRRHTVPYNPEARLDWRLIVNGYLDTMIYDQGRLSQDLDFATLKQLSYINQKAQQADRSAEFSARLRDGLPKRSI